MTNCECKRFVCPDGVWKKNNLLGASCKVMSMSAGNLFKIQDVSRTYTIKDITFRVSLDGKVITIVELNDLPGVYFTWKDIQIIGLDSNNIEDDEE